MARRGGRLAAVGLSGVFHILAFVWLVDQRHAFPPVIEPPPMVVSLVPSLPRRPPDLVPPMRARLDRRQAVLARPPEPQAVRPLVIPDIDRTDSGADRAAPDGFRQTLRGLIGCRPGALAGMTTEERQRCQDQLATRDRGARSPKLNLDMRGEFAGDPEPYLTRKPKNGCKVRAAGDTGVSGQDGGRAGVMCVFSF